MFRLALGALCALVVVLGYASGNTPIHPTPHPKAGVFDNGGVAWSFIAQVPAVNYDTGGQGVAFNAPVPPGQACDSTELTYRSDCVNFKPNGSGSPAYLLGFSASGTYYKYSINVSRSVPSSINMSLADASTGGSWTVQLDGATVATVTTPNTGSYSAFATAQSTLFTPTIGDHTLELLCNGGDAFGGCGDFLNWQGVIASGVTPPAPAAAAGFTTLAIDYDFTQSNPWSNTNNWLRCHDGTGAATPLLYQDWVGFGGQPMPPCSAVISWGNAPLGGFALHLHSDYSLVAGCDPNCTGIYWINLQSVDSAGNGNKIPPNHYVEVTSQIISSNPSMANLEWDHWSYAIDSSIEWDGIEFFGNNIGFTTYHNNSSGHVAQTNQAAFPMDMTAYHKWAWRVTNDGHTDGYFCSYKDDAPAASSPGNCISWQPSAGQLSGSLASTATVQFQLGFAGCGSGGGPRCPNSSMDEYITHLRVWSCAGVNSANRCLTSTPNP